jgi:hypothetical protein
MAEKEVPALLQDGQAPQEGELNVYLVEEWGVTYERPRRSRYYLPSGARVHTVRDRSGAPIAVYVRASSPQEALALYIATVCSGRDQG